MNRWWYILLPLALILLILPAEAWKWQVAQARMLIRDGDATEAAKILEKAVENYPQQTEIRLQWFQALAKLGQRDRCRELAKELASQTADDPEVLKTLVEGFHELGDHQQGYQILVRLYDEKIKELLQSPTSLQQWDILQLNSVAYASYLADTDTAVWYQKLAKRLGVQEEVSFAIYRSEGLKLVDRSDLAVQELIRQLDRLEKLQTQSMARWRRDIRQWMGARDWPQEESPEMQLQRMSLTNLRELIGRVGWQGLRVVNDKTDIADRERFRKASYQANQLVNATIPMTPRAVCGYLDYYSQLFDTRGCLAMAEDDWDQAANDLEACGVACDLLRALGEPTDYFNSQPVVEIPEVMELQHQRQKGWAVIYYHRSQARKQLGMDDAGQHDLKQVQDLGFEPGPELY